LIPKTVEIKKKWIDNYIGSEAHHYTVNIELDLKDNSDIYHANDTIATSTAITANETISDAVIFKVPQYLSNGNSAIYTVKETNQQYYGYVYDGDQEFNAVTIDNVIYVTNRLPLTTVNITKEWEDGNNCYNLRPDSITVQLQRRTLDNNGTAWGSDNDGWKVYDTVAETWKSITEATDPDTITISGTTGVFTGLPKFDENNHQYEYRVTETQVNAYDTYYKDSTDNFVSTLVFMLDNADSENTDMSFNIKNKLITAPITLKKVWKDNGHHETHYPVTFTVAKPDDLNMIFNSQEFTLNGSTENECTNTSTSTETTWTMPIGEFPVYDKIGNPIEYIVTEDNHHQFGYAQESNENGKAKVTNTIAYTGYANPYNQEYAITNILPVTTSIKAVKHWNGDPEKYPNKNAEVTVSLTRSYPDNAVITQDTVFNTDNHNTKRINYTASTETPRPDDFVVFDNLLVCAWNNEPFTYKITEQPVKGYTDAIYSPDQMISVTASADAQHTVTIYNNPKKATNVQFVKYDVTDLEKHGTENNFSLIALANAKFKLYRINDDLEENDSNKIKQINIIQDKDKDNNPISGSYSMTGFVTDSNTASAVITSNSEGKIILNNLEPNKYYLIETEAPDGYQLNEESQDNPRKFEFEVKINDANEIEIVCSEKKVTVAGDVLKIDHTDFTLENAKTAFTDLSEIDDSYTNIHGIPDEEKMSHLTLTKVDATNRTPLPNAYYYLLRLYNYEYRKDNIIYNQETKEAQKTAYLTNALATLTKDGYSDIYWENRGIYVTDSTAEKLGQIHIDGHMFGTYVFYEIKAPMGYERNLIYNDTYVSTSGDFLGPVEFNETNANHGVSVHNLTHLEPRKKVSIKVLKTDESGNPLRGAEFELYTADNNTKVQMHLKNGTVADKITTDYDGMNPIEIVLDTADYNWGTNFYFKEVNPPKGYSADAEKIYFTLTRATADETLHIVRANDSRLKGKVTLTKISSGVSASNNAEAGTPLSDAKFELYKKNDDTDIKLAVYAHSPDDFSYCIGEADKIPTDYPTAVQILKTGTDGKLHIEGLEWGDYYLKEITASTGFKLPENEEAKRIYFSVGRNTCETDSNGNMIPQELTMKNDPLTAKLNIVKHINELNIDAWGEPTFIFKIRQTHYYDYSDNTFKNITENQPTLTKTITLNQTNEITENDTGYQNDTKAFNIDAGTYVITEVKTARYTAVSVPVITGKEYTSIALTLDSATFSIAPNGEATVKFSNTLTNYAKQSHVDKKINTFNGYKAIKLNDKDGLLLQTPPENEDEDYEVTENNNTCIITIKKSAFSPVLIRSDGELTDIQDTMLKDLTITCFDTEIKISENDTKDSIIIEGRKEAISGSVYQLTAMYDEDPIDTNNPTLTTTFEIRFKSDSTFTKTEKTVIFQNDTANKSYVGTSTEQNDVYTLIFIYKGDDLKKILHNGTVVFQAETGSITKADAIKQFPHVNIHSLFENKVEFEKWSYQIDQETSNEASDAGALLTAINNSTGDSSITVTAVLKDKTTVTP